MQKRQIVLALGREQIKTKDDKQKKTFALYL